MRRRSKNSKRYVLLSLSIFQFHSSIDGRAPMVTIPFSVLRSPTVCKKLHNERNAFLTSSFYRNTQCCPRAWAPSKGNSQQRSKSAMRRRHLPDLILPLHKSRDNRAAHSKPQNEK